MALILLIQYLGSGSIVYSLLKSISSLTPSLTLSRARNLKNNVYMSSLTLVVCDFESTRSSVWDSSKKIIPKSCKSFKMFVSQIVCVSKYIYKVCWELIFKCQASFLATQSIFLHVMQFKYLYFKYFDMIYIYIYFFVGL